MDKAGDILKEFFSFYDLSGGEIYASLFSSWRKIAGDDIASHSRVADLRKGALIVELDHPGWMQMLQIKNDEILQKLRAKYPALDIRMLQGKLVKEGGFSLPSKPPIDSGKVKAAPDAAIFPAKTAALPQPGLGGEEASLQNIRSPELKEAFLRLKKTLKDKNRKKEKR